MLLMALLIAPLVAREMPPPKPAAIVGTWDNTIKAVKNTIDLPRSPWLYSVVIIHNLFYKKII